MNERLIQRLRTHLAHLYPQGDVDGLTRQVAAVFWPDGKVPRPEPRALNGDYWSAEDNILITYGDTVRDGREPTLRTLLRFIDAHMGDVITGVHVLPFFPFSSDDGFAVMDYYKVREGLGHWGDIEQIARKYRLMSDLVINHASAEGVWFQGFKAGDERYDGWFATASPEDDLSAVIRPRATPLLTAYETVRGTEHVWCTFGPDQVDLNFKNPEVLIEFVRIVRFYIDHGVRIFRLDAVAFLWKLIGTTSINLPQTHEIVRLLRTLCDFAEERVILITETNVPNNENLSYFGNQNEAHAIYNFPLPPLVTHALLAGNASYLRRFVMGMPPAQDGCTFLNFTASHDGIGLRPAEGLLPQSEIEAMIDTVKRFGGRISMRATRDGHEKPYEMNVALFETMKGTMAGEDEHQFDRFIASQTIAMALEGIPAFYIHSMLATNNWHEGFARTGHNRTLNRKAWPLGEIEALLEDAESINARVLKALKALIALRGKQPAFHPNAIQFTLQLPPQLFGVWRQSPDRKQSIFAITNVTKEPQMLALTELNLIHGQDWFDLLGQEIYHDLEGKVRLAPYQTVWISNR